MTAHTKTSRLNRLFHKPQGRSHRRSFLRYGLLTFSRFIAAATARIAPGAERELAWQELRNKILTFTFFEHINIILDVTKRYSSQDKSSQIDKILIHDRIEDAVKKIRALAPENRVWALEGVGYIYAEQALKKKETPMGILQDNKLPPWSLGGLHSGMGMAFANWFLNQSQNQDTSSGSFEMIEQYHTLARQNSLAGCTGILLDSLGFISRLMAPVQLPEIGKQLQEIDKDFAAYFWHGVGRALCFLPQNMWPGRSFPWRAVEMAIKEAPHELGHVNMLSGLAWPFTLVNLREPRILENVLKYHRETLIKNDAFSKGICAALVLLAGSIDDRSLIDSFLEHHPDPAEPGLPELWQQVVKEPGKKALANPSPHLKNRYSWSQLFKYD